MVDTETDGLSRPIHAVEIAAQRFEGLEQVGPPFRVFLNHDIPIPADAYAVHGYDREFLRVNGIDPRRAYENLWDYVGGARLAAHFAQYDWKQVLIPESARLGVAIKSDFGFCTWRLARRALPGHSTWSLDHLRSYYDLRCGRAHSASGDVEAVCDLITRVIRPELSRFGFTEPAHFAAFSKLPLKICRLITGGKAFGDPEEAIDVALEASLTQDRLLSEEEARREQLVQHIENCSEQRLQHLAVELGLWGDEVEVVFKNRRFRFTGTLLAASRKEAAAAVSARGGEAGKYWPPDYLILGGAAPGGSSLRSALVRLQQGAEGPVLISEEEFMAALHATPVLNEDGSLNPDLSQLRFTPHRATTRTGQFLRRRSAWAANPKRSLKVKSSD